MSAPANEERLPLTEGLQDLSDLVLRFEETGIKDVPSVGGKNASLGELTRALTASGVAVPEGFATTATAYRLYLEANGIREAMASRL
ncbi:PEP/pyruvate-binding domain-containing protein, partial [Sinomonas sp.]|uniref:PEP/pyruvate-binding domain-containing protein n=1 Tax=Sinomonas sp. TaxID=1914986 RepID=UPI002FE2B448